MRIVVMRSKNLVMVVVMMLRKVMLMTRRAMLMRKMMVMMMRKVMVMMMKRAKVVMKRVDHKFRDQWREADSAIEPPLELFFFSIF